MFSLVNKVLFISHVKLYVSYLESQIIDLDYLLLVVLSKKDISHAPGMYISINQLITKIECSQDEPSNRL